jgi:hypothetical protein
MDTSHGGLDGKRVCWHCQSISTASPQQCHSIASSIARAQDTEATCVRVSHASLWIYFPCWAWHSKSGMLVWHRQSISKALPDCCHSISRAMRSVRTQKQPVYEQAMPSCGLTPLLGRAQQLGTHGMSNEACAALASPAALQAPWT